MTIKWTLSPEYFRFLDSSHLPNVFFHLIINNKQLTIQNWHLSITTRCQLRPIYHKHAFPFKYGAWLCCCPFSLPHIRCNKPAAVIPSFSFRDCAGLLAHIWHNHTPYLISHEGDQETYISSHRVWPLAERMLNIRSVNAANADHTATTITRPINDNSDIYAVPTTTTSMKLNR